MRGLEEGWRGARVEGEGEGEGGRERRGGRREEGDSVPIQEWDGGEDSGGTLERGPSR